MLCFNELKNDTENHHLSVEQRKTSKSFSGKNTSARTIASCCHGKDKNLNDFRAVSERFQRLAAYPS